MKCNITVKSIEKFLSRVEEKQKPSRKIHMCEYSNNPMDFPSQA